MTATNIYGIPSNLWNQLSNEEKKDFNYKFLGGVQNKDIKYSEIFNPSAAINANVGMYVERLPAHGYLLNDLVRVTDPISGVPEFYVCANAHTSALTFALETPTDWTHMTCDNDVVVTAVDTTAIGNSFDAKLNDVDVKNIKTYRKDNMVQAPVPGIVTGVTGSEINTSVTITKKFFDVLWNDIIKQTYHRIKQGGRFNI